MRLKMRQSTGLWVAQGLLAGLFLFAGVTKLVMPVEALTAQSSLPGGFLRFIGGAEVLGALGLILPGLFGIARRLTPLAAGGLVVIMTGATAISLAQSVLFALFPLGTGVLAAFVTYGRTQEA